MNSNLDPRTEALTENAPVVYEQPLNERMRTFLRLEFLYGQASYHGEGTNPWSTRAAVTSLLEILAITTRSDSRSDVLKELERHVNVLRDFQSKSGVDPARLNPAGASAGRFVPAYTSAETAGQTTRGLILPAPATIICAP